MILILELYQIYNRRKRISVSGLKQHMLRVAVPKTHQRAKGFQRYAMDLQALGVCPDILDGRIIIDYIYR
jgi:hypothetical protein